MTSEKTDVRGLLNTALNLMLYIPNTLEVAKLVKRARDSLAVQAEQQKRDDAALENAMTKLPLDLAGPSIWKCPRCDGRGHTDYAMPPGPIPLVKDISLDEFKRMASEPIPVKRVECPQCDGTGLRASR